MMTAKSIYYLTSHIYLALYDKHLCSIAGPYFTQFDSPTDCSMTSNHLTRNSIIVAVSLDRICHAHVFRLYFWIFFMDGSLFEAVFQTVYNI